jgi:D-alanyl-D-alanine carboxypeptidase
MGEFLGGSEDRFAQMMTLRARSLGMNHTTFTNASGLPDPDQWTTARDLAILARRLLSDFPSYYGYFSTPNFVWQRRVIPNHDNLLRTYPGADGMKTGYTDAAGHNLVTSAVRGGERLIGVVLGASSNSERDVHMTALLDRSFEELDIPAERHGNGTRLASRLGLIARANAAEPVREATVRHRPTKPVSSWGIQVGSFSSQRAARHAAVSARKLTDDGDVRIEPATVHHRMTWRAQITGLSASEAQSACNTLARRKHACMVLRPEQGEIAAR